jgi:hypothetical protein
MKKRRPTESDILESAITLVEATLRLDILDAHKRDVINGMLWKITEARGKYTTRFRSARACNINGTEKLQHEHVFPRKVLIAAIMAEPARARELLQSAVACVVTVEEHRRLNEATRKDPQLRGWGRYSAAGITIIDTDKQEG